MEKRIRIPIMKNEIHSTRATDIYSQISEESSKDLALQKLIKIVLYSRVATGKELEGDIKLSKKTDLEVKKLINTDGGKIWLEVNKYSDELAGENPEMALNLGINLWDLETSTGTEQDEINGFLKTTGLTILGNDGIKKNLAEYLENDEKGKQLGDDFKTLMDANLSSFDSPEAFSDPQAYMTLVAIYAGLGLKDEMGNKAKELYELAKRRVIDSDVRNAFKIEIDNFKDCNFMKARFDIAMESKKVNGPDYISPSSALVAEIMVFDLMLHNKDLQHTINLFKGKGGYEIVKNMFNNQYWGNNVYDKRLINVPNSEVNCEQVHREIVRLLSAKFAESQKNK